MARPEESLPRRNRSRLAAFCILHSAFFILSSCSAFRHSFDSDPDDDALDMQPHPRRAETPSIIGPESVRVHPGKFPVVQFGADDWKLAPSETAKVRTVAHWMTAHPERVLVAAGARAESPEYARQLSDLRAQTVRRALVSAGVADERILTVSFGEDAPPSTGSAVSFSIIGTGDPR